MSTYELLDTYFPSFCYFLFIFVALWQIWRMYRIEMNTTHRTIILIIGLVALTLSTITFFNTYIYNYDNLESTIYLGGNYIVTFTLFRQALGSFSTRKFDLGSYLRGIHLHGKSAVRAGVITLIFLVPWTIFTIVMFIATLK